MSAVTSIAHRSASTPTFRQLQIHIDQKHEAAWCFMSAPARPCFTTVMLDELNDWFGRLRHGAAALGVRYHVIASAMPGVYNLGGDLDLFSKLIQQQDREGLLDYGIRCIDALHANLQCLDSGVTTISLVQGDALGGGFEAALSSDVIIAERGTRMGFPEILFNLFPGMGAYSLLSRKLDAKQAERMMLSGDLYSAETLHDMGLVDVLAEPGDGALAVYEHIRRENRSRNGFRAVRKVRNTLNPLGYRELRDVLEIWVDAALALEPRDLRMMQRLVSRQTQLGAAAA
ncbi:MAG: crotonase/enoyl-CoA hydratase family protein [Thiohalocapsa sp.]|jgi:DSF synthase|uniref:crotonase/enoyl-CoA hydratase family protein n=1 Tax=Thiohalocapsa sp. TaxID=2497641 RepID=UPI0025D3DA6A|nr:crotonase/enoyl-CoA hydratase family protein [Thiohalocapsa sp.]MCG6941734.1 crotonase/enoyl-CoA hydratase family protein [Thiohalocapsa sp.]